VTCRKQTGYARRVDFRTREKGTSSAIRSGLTRRRLRRRGIISAKVRQINQKKRGSINGFLRREGNTEGRKQV